MSRIKSKDTSLEVRVRSYLYSKGYRYRIHYNIPGKPDIVFLGRKVAIFINGCFWHMHGCKLSSIPSTRRNFWLTKLSTNNKRDETNYAKLNGENWKVVVVWECELLADPSKIFQKIESTLS